MTEQNKRKSGRRNCLFVYCTKQVGCGPSHVIAAFASAAVFRTYLMQCAVRHSLLSKKRPLWSWTELVHCICCRSFEEVMDQLQLTELRTWQMKVAKELFSFFWWPESCIRLVIQLVHRVHAVTLLDYSKRKRKACLLRLTQWSSKRSLKGCNGLATSWYHPKIIRQIVSSNELKSWRALDLCEFNQPFASPFRPFLHGWALTTSAYALAHALEESRVISRFRPRNVDLHHLVGSSRGEHLRIHIKTE